MPELTSTLQNSLVTTITQQYHFLFGSDHIINEESITLKYECMEGHIEIQSTDGRIFNDRYEGTSYTTKQG